VKRASLLDLKLVQAFARVSLARDPITSFIFLIRSLDLLRDFALTLNLETPHTKKVKRLAVKRAGKPDLLQPHLCMVSLSQFCISFMVCLAQSLQTITTLEASCRFIFAGMCLFVFIYALAHSWDGLRQKNFSK
jgi:hypothetical protein